MPTNKQIPKKFYPVRPCENCGTEFLPVRTWQKFCSRFCSQAAHWKNKLNTAPPSVLDAPRTGPSAAQEAEWKRRQEIARASSIIPDNLHGQELLKEAQEALPNAIEKLFGQTFGEEKKDD